MVKPGAPLTLRERQVLDLIAFGKTNTQIGQELYVTEATAKTVVARVLRKLRASNRAHAVRLGYELGLFATDGDE